MLKFLLASVMVCLLAAAPLFSAQGNPSALQALKIRQKQESKQQKAQDKLARQSLKSRNVPKIVRKHLKSQLKAQNHALRRKHKRERQALKNERRMMKKGSRQ